MTKLIFFADFSSGLLDETRASVAAPGFHGFYRFFAWGFILALIVVNIDRWFREPFAPFQIA